MILTAPDLTTTRIVRVPPGLVTVTAPPVSKTAVTGPSGSPLDQFDASASTPVLPPIQNVRPSHASSWPLPSKSSEGVVAISYESGTPFELQSCWQESGTPFASTSFDWPDEMSQLSGMPLPLQSPMAEHASPVPSPSQSACDSLGD